MASDRRHRLTGEGAFVKVLREGDRFDGRHLRLSATAAAADVGRVGLVVGKHHIRLAVDRNYARRLMREAARARRPAIDQFDIVLRLRRQCEPDHVGALGGEAGELLDLLLRSKAR